MREAWKTLLAVATFAALMLLLTATARAEDNPPPLLTPDPPPLDQRLANIERSNAELRDRLAALERADRDRAVAPPSNTPQLWRVPGGEWMTEADLRRTVPGVRFPHDPPAVSGVTRSSDPFVQGSGCSAAGCNTISATPVRRAGTAPETLTYSVGTYREGTSTNARSAGTAGSTDGCASGNCAAPTSRPVSRGMLFRR